jgi:sulfur relay (sulfurtransferase) complex TusBCD TusD component (DsrE family)
MSLAIEDVRQNVKLARNLIKQGNYEMAMLFYQNSIQQIQTLASTLDNQLHRKRWLEVRISFWIKTYLA